MLFGRAAGSAVDRFGRVQVTAGGALVSALIVTLLGLAGSPGVLAGLWFLAGVGSALIWAGMNTLVVEAVPSNRAGAVSVVSGFKFAGHAVAPLAWLPLYHMDPELGFAAAAVVAALAGVLVLPLRRAPTRATVAV